MEHPVAMQMEVYVCTLEVLDLNILYLIRLYLQKLRTHHSLYGMFFRSSAMNRSKAQQPSKPKMLKLVFPLMYL